MSDKIVLAVNVAFFNDGGAKVENGAHTEKKSRI